MQSKNVSRGRFFASGNEVVQTGQLIKHLKQSKQHNSYKGKGRSKCKMARRDGDNTQTSYRIATIEQLPFLQQQVAAVMIVNSLGNT